MRASRVKYYISFNQTLLLSAVRMYFLVGMVKEFTFWWKTKSYTDKILHSRSMISMMTVQDSIVVASSSICVPNGAKTQKAIKTRTTK